MPKLTYVFKRVIFIEKTILRYWQTKSNNFMHYKSRYTFIYSYFFVGDHVWSKYFV